MGQGHLGYDPGAVRDGQMSQAKEFHKLDDAADGLFRELGPV